MRASAGRAAAVRAVVVPDWLAEVVRPRRAPVPWPAMIRAALAICVPLSVSLALGRGSLGVLPATGGLLGTMTDTGGPYLSRVKRVTSAAVFGGAAGLAIGSVTHGHGWLAVVALTVVAGVSGVLSAIGDIGSVTGLQLLVYTALGTGPLGALRPAWHTVAGFLLGVIWALILILPGWLRYPHGKEQRDVAAVYTALAELVRSVGTAQFTARRQALTSALNTAYDELLTARSTATGRNQRTMRLGRALNASHLMAEAAVALGVAGTRPPPLVIDTVARLGDAIRDGAPPPMIPPPWDQSPAMLTLRDAMAGAARALSRDWSPEHRTRAGLGDRVRAELDRSGGLASRLGGLASRLLDDFGGGRLIRLYTLRLMTCMGVAGVVSEVLPLQRSYWVPLTVAIVLKPDYGSVFARALQRGIGTVVGAVVGAAVLVLLHGTWLLHPVRGVRRAAALRAQPELRAALDLPDPAGGPAHRPAHPGRLAAGRGQAGRHADRLRDRAGHRVPAVADELVRAPAPAVRADRARRVRVHGCGPARPRGPRRRMAGAGRRPTRRCGGRPTGPWPTCAPSSSAPCPSRPRSAAAPRPGGPRWWGLNR